MTNRIWNLMYVCGNPEIFRTVTGESRQPGDAKGYPSEAVKGLRDVARSGGTATSMGPLFVVRGLRLLRPWASLAARPLADAVYLKSVERECLAVGAIEAPATCRRCGGICRWLRSLPFNRNEGPVFRKRRATRSRRPRSIARLF
jgi:hypothetical protein